MGIFDLPAPLFEWIDAQLAAAAPPALRLIIWGVIGALVSMFLYKALSAQDRIAADKQEIKTARHRLDTFDGEFADAWPLIRNLLQISFRHVGRVGWPGIVASLPLLALLSYLSTAYGYGYPPPGEVPEIRTSPSSYHAEWIDAGSTNEMPHIVIADGGKRRVADIAIEAPVPAIHKRQWWNTLIGNPAGYLPEDAAIDRVSVSLPRKAFLPFGPGWMQGWETLFFLSLVVVSLIIKSVARIE